MHPFFLSILSLLLSIPLSLFLGGYVVMAKCAGCAKNQNWLRVGQLCQNGEKADQVLDIAGYNLNKGARMSSWAYHGGDNQKWIFEACTRKRTWFLFI